MPKGKQPFIILLSLTVIILIGFVTFLKQSGDKKKALAEAKLKILNEQKFSTFRDGYFRVDYPYWPDLDPKLLLDAKAVKKAANNNNCSVVISKNTLAKNQSFKDYVENALKEQTAKFEKVKLLTKEVSDTESTLIGELTVSNVTLYSYSKGYLTKGGIYSVAFISPKKDFEMACSPFLKKTFDSVKIN